MRKRIIIDKADRLYQMPHPVEDFYPHSKSLTGKRPAELDIARPVWGDTSEHSTPLADGSEDNGLERLQIDDPALTQLHELIAGWAEKELSLRLDPRKEIFVGGSVKRLLSLVGLGFLDPGDLALYPNPGYPIYRQTILSYGAEPLAYRLTEKREFKPRLKQFAERVGRAARMMFLNNPHNPSGAELDAEDLDELLWLAARDNILVVTDAAYYPYRETEGVSTLASASGKRIGLELYSFSYLTGISGAPIGFALGSKELIAGLEAAARVNGQSLARGWVTRAVSALERYPSSAITATRARIRETRPVAEKLCDALMYPALGSTTFPYMLAHIPQRRSSQACAASLLRKHGIVSLPGVAFGDLGEGYLRLTTTTGPMKYNEALQRVSRERQAG